MWPRTEFKRRIPFQEIFSFGDNREVIAKVPVRFGDVTVPAGVPLVEKDPFGGLDLAQLADRDLAIEQEDGILLIRGYYL